MEKVFFRGQRNRPEGVECPRGEVCQTVEIECAVWCSCGLRVYFYYVRLDCFFNLRLKALKSLSKVICGIICSCLLSISYVWVDINEGPFKADGANLVFALGLAYLSWLCYMLFWIAAVLVWLYMQYKRKLGLYIKYFHTVKSASGAESSRVNTVWKNS